MPRFFYEWMEFEDGSWEYGIFDRRRGSDNVLAYCGDQTDAERIAAALNAPKLASVFG
jgi:hypothetical protein